ncbi:hypothetical protein HPB50_014280 [Hyalomma asiaticum]|uniref:Uncharacterized protein n=1 Tax=Hyalomma asiaticum TaxID=266040 RepID=A0ACB7S0S5_HYAAI|nr:hypothetical protein HPB50_014280 [Hyalomma asiaticum]
MTADEIYERSIALAKGAPDRRKTELFRKHKVGMEFSESEIKAVGDGEWQVKSKSLQEFCHTVQKTSEECNGCELYCEYCHACHRMYTCSCLDHVTYAHMCKHIHAVPFQQLQHGSSHNHSEQVDFTTAMENTESAAVNDPGALMVAAHEIVLGAAHCWLQKGAHEPTPTGTRRSSRPSLTLFNVSCADRAHGCGGVCYACGISTDRRMACGSWHSTSDYARSNGFAKHLGVVPSAHRNEPDTKHRGTLPDPPTAGYKREPLNQHPLGHGALLGRHSLCSMYQPTTGQSPVVGWGQSPINN